MKIPALLLLLWLPPAFADFGGQNIVVTFRQNCTIMPPTADLPVIAGLLKKEAEIARLDLQGEQVKPALLREKEILEGEMNLAKSKCLIKQLAARTGSDVTAKTMESNPEHRSLLSQLSIYQGMASRELERFREKDPCLTGSEQLRLKCMIDTQKRIAHVQASLNAVEFYLDVHRLALQRNPNLSLAEIGQIVEKRFKKDIEYLKSLPEPGEDEGDNDGDDIENLPSPTAEELVPAAAVK